MSLSEVRDTHLKLLWACTLALYNSSENPEEREAYKAILERVAAEMGIIGIGSWQGDRSPF